MGSREQPGMGPLPWASTSSSLLNLSSELAHSEATDPVFLRDLSTFLSAIPSDEQHAQPSVSDHFFLGEQVNFLLNPGSPAQSIQEPSASQGLEFREPAARPGEPSISSTSQPSAFSSLGAVNGLVVSQGPDLLVKSLEAELYSTTKVIMAALKSDKWQSVRGMPPGTPALDAVQQSTVLRLVRSRLAAPGLSDEAQEVYSQLQNWVQAMHNNTD